jgi:hypothetical protein
MSRYYLALGHSVPAADLDLIVPQPASPVGVQAAQRDFSADGSVFETGLHIWLLWNSVGSASNYQDLLTQFGLHNARRAAVTLYAPNFQRGWAIYNGYALRPQTPTYARFARDVRVLVRDLVQIADGPVPPPLES